MALKKNITKQLRQRRTRARIHGTAQKPRLAVFRSNKGVELQLIDDTAGKTLVNANSKEVDSKGSKTEQSASTGELLAKRAIEAGIKKAVFDRRHYRYHGRVKAVADGARKGGLDF